MKECRWLATRICVACNNSWPRNRPVLCHVIWMRWEPWDLEWPWQSMISWRNCCTKCNLRSVAQKMVDQKEAQMITFETTSNETTQRKHETGETTVLFESFRWLAASLFVWVAALCRHHLRQRDVRRLVNAMGRVTWQAVNGNLRKRNTLEFFFCFFLCRWSWSFSKPVQCTSLLFDSSFTGCPGYWPSMPSWPLRLSLSQV